MVFIATELCFPNIIDNHVADFFGSILSGKKVARQRAAISGTCSCSAMASTSSSVKPHNAMQSSSVIMGSSASPRFISILLSSQVTLPSSLVSTDLISSTKARTALSSDGRKSCPEETERVAMGSLPLMAAICLKLMPGQAPP